MAQADSWSFRDIQIVPPSEQIYYNTAISEEARRINKNSDKQKSERDALQPFQPTDRLFGPAQSQKRHSDSVVQRTDLRPTSKFQ